MLMFPPWDHDGEGECGMVLPQFFPCLSRQNGWSGLMFAAQNGHALVVEMLLTNGANKDLQENVCLSGLTNLNLPRPFLITSCALS